MGNAQSLAISQSPNQYNVLAHELDSIDVIADLMLNNRVNLYVSD